MGQVVGPLAASGILRPSAHEELDALEPTSELDPTGEDNQPGGRGQPRRAAGRAERGEEQQTAPQKPPRAAPPIQIHWRTGSPSMSRIGRPSAAVTVRSVGMPSLW